VARLWNGQSWNFGSIHCKGKKIFAYPYRMSSIQWVLVGISPRKKLPGRKVNHPPLSNDVIKNPWSHISISSYIISVRKGQTLLCSLFYVYPAALFDMYVPQLSLSSASTNILIPLYHFLIQPGSIISLATSLWASWSRGLHRKRPESFLSAQPTEPLWANSTLQIANKCQMKSSCRKCVRFEVITAVF
jgi:hypothetical protein